MTVHGFNADCNCGVESSRLGDNKIAFPPYHKHDMRQIMVHRLKNAADSRAHNLFSEKALDMASIKVGTFGTLSRSSVWI